MLNIPPILSVDRIGDGIVINTYLAMERLAIKAFDAIIHPVMSCTIVCSIADLHYLKVSPEEVIEVEHEGTEADPIPYAPPMEIFGGKYYTEADQLYLCTRDSGTILSHPLSALVGLYVELA